MGRIAPRSGIVAVLVALALVVGVAVVSFLGSDPRRSALLGRSAPETKLSQSIRAPAAGEDVKRLLQLKEKLSLHIAGAPSRHTPAKTAAGAHTPSKAPSNARRDAGAALRKAQARAAAGTEAGKISELIPQRASRKALVTRGRAALISRARKAAHSPMMKQRATAALRHATKMTTSQKRVLGALKKLNVGQNTLQKLAKVLQARRLKTFLKSLSSSSSKPFELLVDGFVFELCKS